MPDFALDPEGYDYRPLKEGLSGWDVYALQTGLNLWADPDIVTDGVFGPRTREATLRFQRNRGLTADGIAGIATQSMIARKAAPAATEENDLPQNLLKGMIEKESGYQLGNHTIKYPNGSYDLGVCQINDKSKQLSWEQCFDVAFAIHFQAGTVSQAYDTYSTETDARLKRLKSRGISDTFLNDQRRWELAAGSWNRPAHTAWLAGETDANSSEPDAEERAWIEAYIDRVTSYVTSWS